MAEDLNETHLKRPFDTNEKARLFLIQILSHQKSAKGGKKGKGKGEPREENRRGKREGNTDFCASFLFPSLLPRRCSSLVKNYPFVFIKNRKVKFKMLQRSIGNIIRPIMWEIDNFNRQIHQFITKIRPVTSHNLQITKKYHSPY